MMVAVFLQDYTLERKSMRPSIGMASEINSEAASFLMTYYEGDWNEKWAVWKLPNGDPWTQRLPISSVVLFAFQLDNGKLTHQQKKKIRAAYASR